MNNIIFNVFLALLVFGTFSCSKGGEGKELFKAFNEDKNDYLNDQEFYKAVTQMEYFEAWNTNKDQSLNEEEWSAGVNDFLGGFKVATVEKYGEWDLDWDDQISIEEFEEGLFEMADLDVNSQISEKEFTNWYKEGGKKSKTQGSSS